MWTLPDGTLSRSAYFQSLSLVDTSNVTFSSSEAPSNRREVKGAVNGVWNKQRS